METDHLKTSHAPTPSPHDEAMELQQRRVTMAARQRVPTTDGILHLALRIGSLTTSFVFLGFIIALATRYKKIYPVAYIAAIWAILVDLSEAVALLSKTHSIPRTNPGCLIFLDVLALLWFAPAAFMNAYFEPDSFQYEYDPLQPKNKSRNDWVSKCLWAGCAAAAIRFIILIVSCVDCCSTKHRRRLR